MPKRSAGPRPARAPRGRLAAGALLASLLAGCAAAPPPPPPRSPAEDAILRRQERVSVVGAHFPLLWDPEVLDAVRRTGGEIARAVGTPEEFFHYYIVDQPDLNAFTSPTGEIFFFTGQLAATRTRSELAGVLAHEIAHVHAGHYERLQRTVALGAVPAIAAVVLSGGDPAVFAGTLGLLESYQLHFTREMESEADRLALVYLGRTGFDRRGLIGALGLIERAERLVPSGVPGPLRTHPETAMRIAALEQALGVPPGERYEPEADSEWDRVRAILAARQDPERARREHAARAARGGAPELALLGVVLERSGDHQAAAEAFRAAAEAEPRESRHLAGLGSALWSLGDAEGARAALLSAERLPGGGAHSRTQFLLGEIERGRGRAAEALERYRRAAALAPELPEAHYHLALALSGTDRLGEADFHFARAAELRGDYLGALRGYRRARARLSGDVVWEARIDAALRRMR